jgi:hypothetical protein
MSNVSRRSLVTSAAALPALAVPAAAVAATETGGTLALLANQICAEHDRLGTLGRDIEDSDWELYRSLNDQLWETPAASISDLAAKARILDKECRIDGIPHSTSTRVWDLIDELLAMAVQS